MLSMIVPVLNEAPSLEKLAGEIRWTCVEGEIDYELIFVDDGSVDESWETISRLADTDPHIQGVRFRRNFGKAAALSAGIEVSRGEILFCLDADLQDDPAEIPRFLERLEQGMDVVNGWKERRLDPWHKVYPSKVFNWMVIAHLRGCPCTITIAVSNVFDARSPESSGCTGSFTASSRSWPTRGVSKLLKSPSIIVDGSSAIQNTDSTGSSRGSSIC